MHIDKYEEAMMNCRFCFMCRHLSTIGQVRCTEVDTPRIRAAMLYGLKTGTNSFDTVRSSPRAALTTASTTTTRTASRLRRAPTSSKRARRPRR